MVVERWAIQTNLTSSPCSITYQIENIVHNSSDYVVRGLLLVTATGRSNHGVQSRIAGWRLGTHSPGGATITYRC